MHAPLPCTPPLPYMPPCHTRPLPCMTPTEAVPLTPPSAGSTCKRLRITISILQGMRTSCKGRCSLVVYGSVPPFSSHLLCRASEACLALCSLRLPNKTSHLVNKTLQTVQDNCIIHFLIYWCRSTQCHHRDVHGEGCHQ